MINEEFEHFFLTLPTPNSPQNYNHGTAGRQFIQVSPDGFHEYRLWYKPDLDYVGYDTVSIQYIDPATASPAFLYFAIEIIEYEVVANNDYKAADIGETVTINVLENDYSSSNVVNLRAATLANYGTLSESAIDSTVTFTPNPGFEGIAQFHYTVCDDMGTCDMGMATIFYENDQSSTDTLKIATRSSYDLDLILPVGGGYEFITSPANGTADIYDSEGAIRYTSDLGYVGQDQFTVYYIYDGKTNVVTYVIDVLPSDVPNSYANNDVAFAAINNSVTFNVLDNDGPLTFVQTHTDPAHGTVTNVNGSFTYTPDTDYKGNDQFTCEVCLIGQSSCETSVVYVAVDNHNPSAVSFDLNTVINTPKVIEYNVPVTNWDFVLTSEESDLGGTIDYYPGNQTLTVHNQEVSGFNLLIYTPPTDEVDTEDYFEVEYCITNGDCEVVKIYVDLIDIPAASDTDTLCITDCVWPGDVNRDGAVNITDVLPIGYCAGVVGEQRPNASLGWHGQYSPDWNSAPNLPFNEKHADTNGDGIITGMDTSAVTSFYGKYNNVTPTPVAYLSNIPLFFRSLTPHADSGDLVELEIVLGVPNVPAYDVYGLAFSYAYNPEVIAEGTMNVSFNNQSWMEYNSPMLSMVKDSYENGRVDIAYTRTSDVAASGYGVIGKVEFIVIDDFDFRIEEESQFIKIELKHIGQPMTMNGAGQFVQVMGADFEMEIPFVPNLDNSDDLLIVYPNPVSDVLKVHLNGKDEIEQIRVFTYTGDLVYDSGRIATSKLEIDVSQFHGGMYIVNALTSREMISKKVSVIKTD